MTANVKWLGLARVGVDPRGKAVIDKNSIRGARDRYEGEVSYVDTEVAPRQVGGVTLRQDLQHVAVDGDAALDRSDLAGVCAADRVALEEVGHRGERTEVVDSDEIDVDPTLLGGPEEVAADPTEAVDTHTNAHCSPR